MDQNFSEFLCIRGLPARTTERVGTKLAIDPGCIGGITGAGLTIGVHAHGAETCHNYYV